MSERRAVWRSVRTSKRHCHPRQGDSPRPRKTDRHLRQTLYQRERISGRCVVALQLVIRLPGGISINRRSLCTIENALERDYFMDAEEGLHFGIVDRILERRQEVPSTS